MFENLRDVNAEAPEEMRQLVTNAGSAMGSLMSVSTYQLKVFIRTLIVYGLKCANYFRFNLEIYK